MSENLIFLPELAVIELDLTGNHWLDKSELSAREVCRTAKSKIINSNSNLFRKLFYYGIVCQGLLENQDWRIGKLKAVINAYWIPSDNFQPDPNKNFPVDLDSHFDFFDQNDDFSKIAPEKTTSNLISGLSNFSADIKINYSHLAESDAVRVVNDSDFLNAFKAQTIAIDRLISKFLNLYTAQEAISSFWHDGIDGSVLIPGYPWMTGKLLLKISFFFVEYTFQIKSNKQVNNYIPSTAPIINSSPDSLLDDIRQLSSDS
jgi:hypothetical protein